MPLLRDWTGMYLAAKLGRQSRWRGRKHGIGYQNAVSCCPLHARAGGRERAPAGCLLGNPI